MRALILGCASITVICVYQAPATALAQKRDILYHNALRFLRLDEDASGARPSQEEEPWKF